MLDLLFVNQKEINPSLFFSFFFPKARLITHNLIAVWGKSTNVNSIASICFHTRQCWHKMTRAQPPAGVFTPHKMPCPCVQVVPHAISVKVTH